MHDSGRPAEFAPFQSVADADHLCLNVSHKLLGLAARIGQSDPVHLNTRNSFEHVGNIRRGRRSCPTDLDRSGGAPQRRHGAASESGPVSDSGYPRSRADRDDLHLHHRVTLLGGAAIYTVGLVVMATAGGATSLILSGAMIGVALSCTASSLAMTACARAVSEERRSKVLGLVSAAGSLGTLMIPMTTQSILAHHPWQLGALFFVVLAVMMLPAGFLAGDADRMPRGATIRTTMRAVLGQAVRNRPFLVMSGAYFVCGLNLVFLTTHLPTYLAICGQDPLLSAEAIAVIGGMNSIGSITAGWLGAKYPKHILLGLLYILRAFVFTAYFVMPPTPTSTLLFAAAMGMLWLSVAPLVSGLVADMFGTRYMATLLGIAFVMHQVGSSLGAWGGGVIFDRFGSYDRAWQIGVLVGFAAGVVQILAGGPTRRRDRLAVPRLADALH
jgi:MFS family permease